MATLDEFIAGAQREQDDLHRQFLPFPAVATHLKFFNEEIKTSQPTTKVQIRGIGSSFVVTDEVYGKLGTQTPQPYLGDSRPDWTTTLTQSPGSPFVDNGRTQIREFILGSASAVAPSAILVGSGTFTWDGSIAALSGQSHSIGVTGTTEDNQLGSFISNILSSNEIPSGADSSTTFVLTSGVGLDGTNDYVTMGSPAALNLTDELTISCWVKGDMNRASWQNFVNRGEVGERGYALRPENGNGSVQLLFQATTVGSSTTALSDDTWYHLVGVGKSGSFARIFVNGTKESDVGTASTLVSRANRPFVLGRLGDTDAEYFLGSVDEVIIYNRAVTDSEAQDLYNAGSVEGGHPTGSVVGLWHLDEGTGTSAADSSAEGNDGTLTGGATWITGSVWSGTTTVGAGAPSFTEMAISGGTLFTYDSFTSQTIGSVGSEIRFIQSVRIGS